MMTNIQYTNPPGAGPAQGLYSNATVVPAGSTVHIAGQLSVDMKGDVAGRGNFEAQMRQVFSNIGDVLKGLGLGFNHVIKFNTYLVHSQDIDSFMRIRAELFPTLFGGSVFPPNTLLIIDRLVKEDFLIEVETLAYNVREGAMTQPR